MITPSQAFRTAMKAPVRTIGATVYNAMDGVTYSAEDVLQSIAIKSTGYYYGTNTRSVTIKFLGVNFALLEKTLAIELNVVTDAEHNTRDSISFGTFTVYEQETDLEKNITTIKAYDEMGVLGLVEYKEGELTFPCTVANLASQIAAHFNLTLGTDFTTLPNYDYQITEDLYANIDGETYRDIIAEIAGATATLAKVSTEGELIFRPLATTVDDEFTYDDMKKFKLGTHYGPVNSIVLARTPAEDNIAVVDEAATRAPAGKNRLNVPNTHEECSHDITIDFEDGVGTWSGDWTGYIGAHIDVDMTLPAGTYTFSIGIPSDYTGDKPTLRLRDEDGHNVFQCPSMNAETVTLASETHITDLYVIVGRNDYRTFKPQLEAGSTATDFEPFKAVGVIEVKLANNEILDDDRQSLAQPLLNASDGFEFYPSTTNTIGLGWIEVGDRIRVVDDSGNTYETIITDSQLTIDGGVKEILTSTAPQETQTNYALAGGITKTVYNTEIKVDKQRREIQSIVEEQIQFKNEVMSNFSSIVQNISSIVTSIQNSGGNNLIKNSAMYAKDEDGIPINWTFSETGTWATTPSADASANGSLSGQVIKLAGETVSQVVTVKPDDDSIAEDDKTYYSFSCRIKKTAVGDCTVTLSDGTQEGVWTITVANGEAVNYKEYAIEAILPHSTELTVSVTATNDAEFYITDMMLAVGSFRSQWTQANGEFSNSQVQIDSDGVTVKNSNLAGAFTKVTPQGVEVYLNSQLIALINNETIKAPIGEFTKEVDMPPIKIVAQSDGWAFVEKEN